VTAFSAASSTSVGELLGALLANEDADGEAAENAVTPLAPEARLRVQFKIARQMDPALKLRRLCTLRDYRRGQGDIHKLRIGMIRIIHGAVLDVKVK
jgi:hypothetical protein